jgi:TolB-like protein
VGRVVDTSGDGVLAEFGSALEAVRCAVAVQENLRERNRALPPASAVRFRVGIDLGDVRVEGERIYGSGVNVAARLEALAPPGGLCISAPVHEQVRYQLDRSFRDLGERRLKNIPHPVHAYALAIDGSPPRVGRAIPGARAWIAAALGAALLAGLGWWSLQRLTIGASPIRSIAVLPLENLSGDPEQEYVADGMTEELIGELAKLRDLRVISRTSVMRYKDTPKSIPEIAAELGVEGALEGTVTREQGRIRVTVQLIDAWTDTHLWADRFDREVSSVLALRSEVARAVAEQLHVELTPEERVALTASRTVDPRAYDAYLRGLWLVGPGSLVRVWGPQAIERFERAVELAPDFAAAYAELARARVAAGFYFGLSHLGEFARAREAAERALELDDRLGAAHAAVGFVHLFYDWDFPEAGRAFGRAVELSPSDPAVLEGHAWYLVFVEGRIADVLDLAERLLRVAPLDLSYRATRMRLFYFAREYERALEEVERIREL